MAVRSLFDITKIIFEKPGEWTDISKGEKKKNFFAIQRRFSLQFPMQANALQSIHINQVGVIDFWQSFMRKMYQRTPSWMYTKGIKKTKESQELKTKVSEKIITEYARAYNLDRKAVVDALFFYNKEMVQELKVYEKIINQK